MRRLAVTLLFVGLCTFILVGAALSVIYPPGPPPGTCTDTLEVANVENPAAACHPAAGTPGDSLLGIKGVVIGEDKDFGPFALYIQTQTGVPWSGIQVFTSSGNFATGGIAHGGVNINVGDVVAVYGDYEEFNGGSEIATGSIPNDIKLVRRVSNGTPQPLPPFHIGTTTELNWIPSISAATAEPWEACLVKVRGPLVVKRNTTLLGLGSRSFLVVNQNGTAPNDSLAIDGFTLSNIPAPAVDAVIDSVQGVFTQTSIGGISSYRILLRDTGDLFAALPPSITDAYMIADDQVRCTFDRPVSAATATNAFNYTFASGNTALSAAFEGGSNQTVVIVTIDNAAGYTHGLSETITASNLRSFPQNVLQGTPQQRTYAFGVMSIEEVQTPDPARLGGAPCADGSLFTTALGFTATRISMRGVCTGVFGITYYVQDALSPTRNGIALFRPNDVLVPGHQYLFAGQIQEFDGTSSSIPGGFTEAVNKVYLLDEGAVSPPAPVVQTISVLGNATCDGGQNLTTAEDYEGVLVKVQKAKIVENRDAGASFLIAGPFGVYSDTMLVSNSNNAYTFNPDSNNVVDVTGVIEDNPAATPLTGHPSVNPRYRLLPRSNADIVLLGTLAVNDPSGVDRLSLSVSPNPSRSANVNFALPKGGNVELAVYDLTGRKLATLADGAFKAGRYSRQWNGVDGTGQKVHAGVFFYKLKVDGELLTTKAIKLD